MDFRYKKMMLVEEGELNNMNYYFMKDALE